MKTSRPEMPSFHVRPSQLIQRAVDLIKDIQTATKQLLDKLSPQDATFENVVLSMAKIDNNIKSKVQFLAFFQAVSPSLELRQESSVAMSMVDTAYLELFQDENLFALVDAVHKNFDMNQMEMEDRKFLAKLHSTFIDNGLGLKEKDKKRSQEISKRLVELRVAFTENLSLDPGYIWKKEEDLEGLGAERIQTLPLCPSNGQRGVPLKKTYVNAVLSSCIRSATRKEVFLQSQRIFPENTEVFKEIVILRDERARLLGFESYAHQQARSKLLKSPRDVKSMLDELSMHLRPIAKTELEALQQAQDPPGGPLHLWDFDYHHDKMLRDNYQVDHDLIAEYFPANVTIQHMLAVFETIFGLKIESLRCIRDDYIWQPDVKVFSVHDRHSATFFGFLYLDIYPRDGKFNHAANFNIFPSYSVPEGIDQPFVCTALVCNVANPPPDKPALLKHHEVITLFHELGHAFHDLLGRSKYATFHGHRTVADFVEAPSQLLEYWCWVPECLQRLSCHYSYVSSDDSEDGERDTLMSSSTRPPKQIPRGHLEKLVEARSINQGILTLRQVAFSSFDLEIHCPASQGALKSMDIAEMYYSLLQSATYLQGPENDNRWGHGYATTPHYIWGQEANYYSYLYTRVLAANMWWSNFHFDPMSQKAGLKYRKMILEHGGSQDEQTALMEFLGGQPTVEVYLRYL
ncbi:hypothetical protein PDE_06614 [Penicillium oxalicum 114-2]|uniref:Peptidase M3A/M3B catalytic domain-containing protein n=1 Tax=Penicillium oxalicum (strain 114-2 / CGMCC 5302) TaxID=933388 RepID=S8BA28_PENO1|nr:hypothetical protein PDE_06614 [Penicillium oxalicum 114-2]